MQKKIKDVRRYISGGMPAFGRLLDGKWGRTFSLSFLSFFIVSGVVFFIIIIPKIDPGFLPSARQEAVLVQTDAEENDPAKNFSAGIKSSEKMDYPQALIFFQRAAEKDPSNVNYLIELALIEYKLKDYDAAMAHYQQLIGLDPDNGSSYRNSIANIHWIRKEYDAAESLFRQAIAEEPQQDISYNNLALMLEEQGRHTEALAVLAEGIRESEDGLGLRETLSLIKG